MYGSGASLLASTLCLVLAASVAAGGGGKHWHTQPCSNINPHLPPCPPGPCTTPPCPWPGPSPSPQPSGSSAYDFISNQSDLSGLKALVDQLGLQSTLSGPVSGTLFAPNNAALASYTGSLQSNVSFDTEAGKQFLDLFFGKLINYHILTSSVSPSQLTAGTVYNTAYTSINGNPHTITYSGSGLVDEQQQTVALTGVGSAVSGGGYVHIISGVLQPNDIFPSLTAALTSSSEFTKLLEVVQKIDTGLDMNLVEMLENIAGTMAVPNNQAFDGVDISALDAQVLLGVVMNHFCAFTRYYRLLFTPFEQGKKPGKNPCLTVFSRSANIPYGLAWYYNDPLDIFVSHATGELPDNLEIKNSSIVLADLSFPTHSAHVITTLLLPPTEPTANSSTAAVAKSQKRTTQKLIKTLEKLAGMRATPADNKGNTGGTKGGTNTNGSTGKSKKRNNALDSLIARTKPTKEGAKNKEGENGQAGNEGQQQQQGAARNRKALEPKLSELVAKP